jgi:hypothetical protein
MRPSRGMGDIRSSKMPTSKTVRRKDNPDEVTVYKKGGKAKWIQEAVQKPGSLRKSMGVKEGQKIPPKKLAAAAKKPGKMGKRARLAQTFAKMRKK